MWLAGEGRREEAWNDIKASFKLARLCGKGFTLVEQLVAIAIDGIALNRTVVLLQHGEPDAKFARQVLSDLNALELPCDVVNSFDKGERVFYADTVLTFLENPESAKNLGAGTNAFSVAHSIRIDWNLVLREGNKWYDRLVESARKPTRAERKAAYKQYDADLRKVAANVNTPGRMMGAALSATVRSALVSDALISMMLPALDAATSAEDRAMALLDLTRTAAALAVYRAEQGEYPEKLEQLVPSVLAKVPNDLYTDKPFIYQRMPDGGYLLYSVFQNGTDDGGTDYSGTILAGEWVATAYEGMNYNSSDLVIRVPVPKFEMPAKPQFVE